MPSVVFLSCQNNGRSLSTARYSNYIVLKHVVHLLVNNSHFMLGNTITSFPNNRVTICVDGMFNVELSASNIFMVIKQGGVRANNLEKRHVLLSCKPCIEHLLQVIIKRV